LTAIHIGRMAPTGVETLIVEPRESVGRGVAYGTVDKSHVLNVPADRLSAFSHQPHHFASWGWRRAGSCRETYLPRAWFGDYLSGLAGAVEHVRDRVVDIVFSASGVRLLLSDGRVIRADRAVLAPGAPPPRWPAPLSCLPPSSDVVEDPWAPGALDGIPPRLPVMLIGTGLTAVDVALTLNARRNHEIVALSRHGLLPAAHLGRPGAVAITPPPESSARALVGWYRDAVAEHGDWRPVVDGLRAHTDGVWAALTEAERSRLLRHVHRRWEVARHRMAPGIAARIEDMRESGGLTVRRGDLRGARRNPEGGLDIAFGDGVIRTGSVINCTGPALDVRRSSDPLVQRLLSRQVVRPGPLNLGLDVAPDGEVVGSGGRLWVVGPLRRGQAWETTAIPEIRSQAEAVCRTWWPETRGRRRYVSSRTRRTTSSISR